jgi:hypothetical protein
MTDEIQDELTTQGAVPMQDPVTTQDQLNLIDPAASEQLLVLQGVLSDTSPKVERVAKKETLASTADGQVKPRSTDLFPEILALQNTDLNARPISSNEADKPEEPINGTHSDAVLRTLREELTLLLNDLNYLTEDSLTEDALSKNPLSKKPLSKNPLSKNPLSKNMDAAAD